MEIELTKRHQRALNNCIMEAENVDDMKNRLGSVVISGGKIIQKGHNHQRTKTRNTMACSRHAEMDVLSKILRGKRWRVQQRLPSPSPSHSHSHSPSPSHPHLHSKLSHAKVAVGC